MDLTQSSSNSQDDVVVPHVDNLPNTPMATESTENWSESSTTTTTTTSGGSGKPKAIIFVGLAACGVIIVAFALKKDRNGATAGDDDRSLPITTIPTPKDDPESTEQVYASRVSTSVASSVASPVAAIGISVGADSEKRRSSVSQRISTASYTSYPSFNSGINFQQSESDVSYIRFSGYTRSDVSYSEKSSNESFWTMLNNRKDSDDEEFAACSVEIDAPMPLEPTIVTAAAETANTNKGPLAALRNLKIGSYEGVLAFKPIVPTMLASKFKKNTQNNNVYGNA